MGWSYGPSKHFTWKGGQKIIDRRAECDDLFNWTSKGEDGTAYGCTVVKSSVVGSVYYAAVRRWKGTPTDVVDTRAVVCLTHTCTKDYCDFGYKVLGEDMGPNESKCPVTILDLLDPLNDENDKNGWARAWRDRCREHAAKCRAARAAQLKLPAGVTATYRGRHWYIGSDAFRTETGYRFCQYLSTGRSDAIRSFMKRYGTEEQKAEFVRLNPSEAAAA